MIFCREYIDRKDLVVLRLQAQQHTQLLKMISLRVKVFELNTDNAFSKIEKFIKN